MGTYFFVDEQSKKAVPITQFVDVRAMLQDMEVLARKAESARSSSTTKVKAWNSMRKHFKPEFAPPGPDLQKFLQTLQGMTDNKLGRDGKGRHFHLPHAAGGGHALPGRLQLRHRAREALRDPLRHARRQAVSVLHLQLRPCYREKIERQFSIPWDPKTQQPIAL